MNDDRLYLIHIGECIERVEDYTKGGEVEFAGSRLIEDAILRNLQVLAESTQRLSADLKAAHPQTDWQAIAGFRNVLVHGYLGVDLDRVWAIVRDELPKLKAAVQRMLDELSSA